MTQAQMRFTLNDELTGLLDRLRGPATRTGYALWLLERGLRQEAAPEAAPPSAGDAAPDARTAIRNLPSMR